MGFPRMWRMTVSKEHTHFSSFNANCRSAGVFVVLVVSCCLYFKFPWPCMLVSRETHAPKTLAHHRCAWWTSSFHQQVLAQVTNVKLTRTQVSINWSSWIQSDNLWPVRRQAQALRHARCNKRDEIHLNGCFSSAIAACINPHINTETNVMQSRTYWATAWPPLVSSSHSWMWIQPASQTQGDRELIMSETWRSKAWGDFA